MRPIILYLKLVSMICNQQKSKETKRNGAMKKWDKEQVRFIVVIFCCMAAISGVVLKLDIFPIVAGFIGVIYLGGRIIRNIERKFLQKEVGEKSIHVDGLLEDVLWFLFFVILLGKTLLS